MPVVDLGTIQNERDFYRSLVDLASHATIDELLERALNLMLGRFAARETFIEVIQDDGVNIVPHIAARGCNESRRKEISTFVSRGIISEAMATGMTVVTANASADPRFSELESVQRHELEAVLCVPIGRETPIGVVYLQGGQPDSYTAEVQRDVELVASTLALHLERVMSQRDAVASPMVRSHDDAFSHVRGRSSAMADIVARLRLAAPLDVSILLTGPSGSGKTLLANTIHLASKRKNERLVELNCATIPENLLENELFGAEPGAHSNAPRGGSKGKVEVAQGGTLFLDEIAELTLAAQAKLLQLLQSKTYYRLGGTELRRVDVRVIAATNANLRTAIAEKRFREDLFYRLQVLEVRVPSLAERHDDVVPLAMTFLDQAVERHQLSRKVLGPSALRAVQAAEWPGNVRELANRIESAMIHAHLRGSDRIEGRDLFPDDPLAAEASQESLQTATRRFQKQHVLAVLTSTDWNVLEAARLLDVSRSQVYNLIRAFDLRHD